MLYKELVVLKNASIIENDSKLYDIIKNYRSKSNSTGCCDIDLATLFYNVREFRFKELYEAGTGLSTVVQAYALYLNHKYYGANFFGRITSMEELPKYFKQANKLIPKFLRPYIDLRKSSIMYDHYGIYCGKRYKDIPKRKYDFCWIDGPNMKVSDNNGFYTSNFDLVEVVRTSKTPVYAMVDSRNPTVYVLQQIFGANKSKKVAFEGGSISMFNYLTSKDFVTRRHFVIENLIKRNKDERNY